MADSKYLMESQAAWLRCILDRHLAFPTRLSPSRAPQNDWNSAEGCVILDRNGKVHFLNAEAGRLLGCRPDFLLGAKISVRHDALSDDGEIVLPNGNVRPLRMRVVETRWGDLSADLLVISSKGSEAAL